MVFESMFDNPFFVNLWIHMSISYTLWCVCQSSCLNLFLNCFLLSATATHDICMTLTVHQKKQFPYHDFIRNMLVIIHPKRDFISNWYSLPSLRIIFDYQCIPFSTIFILYIKVLWWCRYDEDEKTVVSRIWEIFRGWYMILILFNTFTVIPSLKLSYPPKYISITLLRIAHK